MISSQTSAPGAKAVPLNPVGRRFGGRSRGGKSFAATNLGAKIFAGRSPAGRKFDAKSHGVKSLGVRNLAEIRPRVARFGRVNGVNCVVGMASAAG